MHTDPQTKLFEVLDKDPTYPLAAYHAIHRGLDFTVRMKRETGHVSGQELAQGMAGYLRSEFGPFALMVLEGWNIRSTLDFGRIVFNLIEAGLMRKQDSDTIEDFLDVYDLQEVFGKEWDWLQDIRPDLGLSVSKPGSLG